MTSMADVFIVEREHMMAIAMRALTTPLKEMPADARHILLAVAAWLDGMLSREDEDRAVCLGCETLFDGCTFPDAVLVMRMWDEETPGTGGYVAGVCPQCYARDDFQAMSVDRLREALDTDVKVISSEQGHA